MSEILVPRLRCRLCRGHLEESDVYVWCRRCAVAAVKPAQLGGQRVTQELSERELKALSDALGSLPRVRRAGDVPALRVLR